MPCKWLKRKDIGYLSYYVSGLHPVFSQLSAEFVFVRLWNNGPSSPLKLDNLKNELSRNKYIRDLNDRVLSVVLNCRDCRHSVNLIAHFRAGQFARQHT